MMDPIRCVGAGPARLSTAHASASDPRQCVTARTVQAGHDVGRPEPPPHAVAPDAVAQPGDRVVDQVPPLWRRHPRLQRGPQPARTLAPPLSTNHQHTLTQCLCTLPPVQRHAGRAGACATSRSWTMAASPSPTPCGSRSSTTRTASTGASPRRWPRPTPSSASSLASYGRFPRVLAGVPAQVPGGLTEFSD